MNPNTVKKIDSDNPQVSIELMTDLNYHLFHVGTGAEIGFTANEAVAHDMTFALMGFDLDKFYRFEQTRPDTQAQTARRAELKARVAYAKLGETAWGHIVIHRLFLTPGLSVGYVARVMHDSRNTTRAECLMLRYMVETGLVMAKQGRGFVGVYYRLTPSGKRVVKAHRAAGKYLG